MKKSEELQLIRDAVQRLGPGSYLGPWLSDQIPSIKGALASDYPPEAYACSIREARIHCEKIITQARDEAEKTRARAKADAEAERQKACRFNDSIRADLLRAIERARHELTKL